MINYYVELGLDPSMDEAALEKALRTLKKKWTTRTNAADLEKRQKAERMIALLNEASRILCNKEDRADYDRKLNREKNKQTAPTINTETPAPVMPTGSGAEALISMAESFYEHGSYQQALETAAKALQAGIDDPRLFNVVSMCYAENGDYERAYATMYDAVARTQDPDMKARLIFLCLRLYQMPQRARALLDEMLHDYPDTNMLVAYDIEYDLYQNNEAMAEAKLVDYRQAYPEDREFPVYMQSAYIAKADTYITEHASGGEYIANQAAMDNYLKYCTKADAIYSDQGSRDKLAYAQTLNKTTFNKDNLGGLCVSVILTLCLLPTIIGGLAFAAISAFLIKFSLIPNWMILRTDYTESYDGPYKIAHVICTILWGWIKWSWKAAVAIFDFILQMMFAFAR